MKFKKGRGLAMVVGQCLLLLAVLSWSKAVRADLQVPELEENRIQLEGRPENGLGVTGWTTGHRVAPEGEGPFIQLAYLRIYGRGAGPAPGNRPLASVGQEIEGFPSLRAQLEAMGASAADLGLNFGPLNGDLEQTWSLDEDVREVDWTYDPATGVEERFYEAEGGQVFTAVYFRDEPILELDYSDILMRLDFLNQDLAGFTHPVAIRRVEGLEGDAGAVADAFLEDVRRVRGYVQTRFQLVADPLTQQDFNFQGSAGAHFAGVSHVQIVPGLAPVELVLAVDVEGELVEIEVLGPEGQEVIVQQAAALPGEWLDLPGITLDAAGGRVTVPLPEGAGTFWRATAAGE